MIDRVFTQAEARYIPNGPGSTADMAHPTRTGDLVVFAYPPYQFDAATPGTLIAQVRVLRAARLRARRAGPGRTTSTCGPRSWPAATGSAGAASAVRSIDIAPTIAYLLGVPEPQQSQGRVLLSTAEGRQRVDAADHHRAQRLPRPARPDDDADGRRDHRASAAPASWRRCSTRKRRTCPARTLLLAGGDNVGASPPNSSLLQDTPTIDVENAWGLDATSYGNHEFDYGVDPSAQTQQEQADFPFLATNIVDETTGEAPDWVTPSKVFRVNGVKVGVIGAGLETTPELVAAGNTDGLKFLPAADRIAAESQRLREQRH